MIRPFRADKTPPTVAVEAREREVGEESPRVSERDMRHRLGLGEEYARRASDASEKELPVDGEDARTLSMEGRNGTPPLVVALGVKCSSTYFLQHVGDPRPWLQQWQ